jgi:hypothetical protein
LLFHLRRFVGLRLVISARLVQAGLQANVGGHDRVPPVLVRGVHRHGHRHEEHAGDQNQDDKYSTDEVHTQPA